MLAYSVLGVLTFIMLVYIQSTEEYKRKPPTPFIDACVYTVLASVFWPFTMALLFTGFIYGLVKNNL